MSDSVKPEAVFKQLTSRATSLGWRSRMFDKGNQHIVELFRGEQRIQLQAWVGPDGELRTRAGASEGQHWLALDASPAVLEAIVVAEQREFHDAIAGNALADRHFVRLLQTPPMPAPPEVLLTNEIGAVIQEAANRLGIDDEQLTALLAHRLRLAAVKFGVSPDAVDEHAAAIAARRHVPTGYERKGNPAARQDRYELMRLALAREVVALDVFPAASRAVVSAAIEARWQVLFDRHCDSLSEVQKGISRRQARLATMFAVVRLAADLSRPEAEQQIGIGRNVLAGKEDGRFGLKDVRFVRSFLDIERVRCLPQQLRDQLSAECETYVREQVATQVARQLDWVRHNLFWKGPVVSDRRSLLPLEASFRDTEIAHSRLERQQDFPAEFLPMAADLLQVEDWRLLREAAIYARNRREAHWAANPHRPETAEQIVQLSAELSAALIRTRQRLKLSVRDIALSARQDEQRIYLLEDAMIGDFPELPAVMRDVIPCFAAVPEAVSELNRLLALIDPSAAAEATAAAGARQDTAKAEPDYRASEPARIADLLLRARQEKNWTLEETAQRTALSKQTIARHERGTTSMGARALSECRTLAAAYEPWSDSDDLSAALGRYADWRYAKKFSKARQTRSQAEVDGASLVIAGVLAELLAAQQWKRKDFAKSVDLSLELVNRLTNPRTSYGLRELRAIQTIAAWLANDGTIDEVARQKLVRARQNAQARTSKPAPVLPTSLTDLVGFTAIRSALGISDDPRLALCELANDIKLRRVTATDNELVLGSGEVTEAELVQLVGADADETGSFQEVVHEVSEGQASASAELGRSSFNRAEFERRLTAEETEESEQERAAQTQELWRQVAVVTRVRCKLPLVGDLAPEHCAGIAERVGIDASAFALLVNGAGDQVASQLRPLLAWSNRVKAPAGIRRFWVVVPTDGSDPAKFFAHMLRGCALKAKHTQAGYLLKLAPKLDGLHPHAALILFTAVTLGRSGHRVAAFRQRVVEAMLRQEPTPSPQQPRALAEAEVPHEPGAAAEPVTVADSPTPPAVTRTPDRHELSDATIEQSAEPTPSIAEVEASTSAPTGGDQQAASEVAVTEVLASVEPHNAVADPHQPAAEPSAAAVPATADSPAGPSVSRDRPSTGMRALALLDSELWKQVAIITRYRCDLPLAGKLDAAACRAIAGRVGVSAEQLATLINGGGAEGSVLRAIKNWSDGVDVGLGIRHKWPGAASDAHDPAVFFGHMLRTSALVAEQTPQDRAALIDLKLRDVDLRTARDFLVKLALGRRDPDVDAFRGVVTRDLFQQAPLSDSGSAVVQPAPKAVVFISPEMAAPTPAGEEVAAALTAQEESTILDSAVRRVSMWLTAVPPELMEERHFRRSPKWGAELRERRALRRWVVTQRHGRELTYGLGESDVVEALSEPTDPDAWVSVWNKQTKAWFTRHQREAQAVGSGFTFSYQVLSADQVEPRPGLEENFELVTLPDGAEIVLEFRDEQVFRVDDPEKVGKYHAWVADLLPQPVRSQPAPPSAPAIVPAEQHPGDGPAQEQDEWDARLREWYFNLSVEQLDRLGLTLSPDLYVLLGLFCDDDVSLTVEHKQRARENGQKARLAMSPAPVDISVPIAQKIVLAARKSTDTGVVAAAELIKGAIRDVSTAEWRAALTATLVRGQVDHEYCRRTNLPLSSFNTAMQELQGLLGWLTAPQLATLTAAIANSQSLPTQYKPRSSALAHRRSPQVTSRVEPQVSSPTVAAPSDNALPAVTSESAPAQRPPVVAADQRRMRTRC